MTVRFGFGLITCQRYPGDARTDTALYAQAVDLAVEAEDLGFDSVWVSEHHFVDDAYLPSLLPLCAAIAARTRRVQVGRHCCSPRCTTRSDWRRTPRSWTSSPAAA